LNLFDVTEWHACVLCMCISRYLTPQIQDLPVCLVDGNYCNVVGLARKHRPVYNRILRYHNLLLFDVLVALADDAPKHGYFAVLARTHPYLTRSYR